MKTGFSTLWSATTATESLLSAIADAGFDGMEPTFNPGAIPSPAGYREEAPILKALCDSAGLAVPGMRGGRLFWGAIPSTSTLERAKAIEHCRRALDAVAMMGGDLLLVVPGEASAAVPYEDHWKRVVEFSDSAVRLAREFGVRIGLENTEALFPASLTDWKQLLIEINDPWIGMYLDIGNITWLEKGNPAEWIRELSQWLVRIHFKDSFAGKCIVNILEGDVDWNSVMGALREIGYDGWVLVEPDWFKIMPERLPQQLAGHLKAILQL